MNGIQPQWNVKKKCFEGCDIWFDGCNDYECNSNGTVVAKTQKTCSFYVKSHCKKCESNLEWNDCGSGCTPTCLQTNPFCSMICVPRCQCPAHRPIYHDGECIRKEDCLAHFIDN